MNDKVKEALETLANLIHRNGAYDFQDECIEIRLYGEPKEYLANMLETKRNRVLEVG